MIPSQCSYIGSILIFISHCHPLICPPSKTFAVGAGECFWGESLKNAYLNGAHFLPSLRGWCVDSFHQWWPHRKVVCISKATTTAGTDSGRSWSLSPGNCWDRATLFPFWVIRLGKSMKEDPFKTIPDLWKQKALNFSALKCLICII